MGLEARRKIASLESGRVKEGQHFSVSEILTSMSKSYGAAINILNIEKIETYNKVSGRGYLESVVISAGDKGYFSAPSEKRFFDSVEDVAKGKNGRSNFF